MKNSIMVKIVLVLIVLFVSACVKQGIEVSMYQQQVVIVEREQKIQQLQSKIKNIENERRFVCKEVNLAFISNDVGK